MPKQQHVLFFGKAVNLIQKDSPSRFQQGAAVGISLISKEGISPKILIAALAKTPKLSIVVMDEIPDDDFHRNEVEQILETLRLLPDDANIQTDEVSILIVQHARGVHTPEQEIKARLTEVDILSVVLTEMKKSLPLGNPRCINNSSQTNEELNEIFKGLIEISS